VKIMEVVLLLLGAAAFVASFVLPEKKERRNRREEPGMTEEDIRAVVRDEYNQSRGMMDDLTDETINYTMEKAERQLERITNEKMLAMGEYSDTILNEINRNHQEVVFLSDMLNQNKNDLTIFLGQAVQDAKEASALASDALMNSKKASEDALAAFDKSKSAMDNSIVAEDNMLSARKIIQGDFDPVSVEQVSEAPINIEPINVEPEAPRPKTTRRGVKKDKVAEAVEMQNIRDNLQDNLDVPLEAFEAVPKTSRKSGRMPSLQFDMGGESSFNNNEKILKLHKQGKSNVAIAKELGLGVGEVKLVIDLFK